MVFVKSDVPLVIVSRKSLHTNCNTVSKSCNDLFKLGTGDMEGMASIAEYREPSRFTNLLSTF